MKALFLTATLSSLLSAPAFAQTMNHDAMGKLSPSPSAAQAPAPPSMTDGVVKKVDKVAGTITLQHAEVKAVRMPAMTMAYKAKDPALLDKVSAGDKVGFSLAQQKDGYLVDAIEKKH